MPYSSLYPDIPIPDGADLWDLLFERKSKPFADNKGKSLSRGFGRAPPLSARPIAGTRGKLKASL